MSASPSEVINIEERFDEFELEVPERGKWSAKGVVVSEGVGRGGGPGGNRYSG